MAIVSEATKSRKKKIRPSKELSEAAATAVMMLTDFGGSPVPVYGIDEQGHCHCHLGATCNSGGKHPINGVYNFVSSVDEIINHGEKCNWGLQLGKKTVCLDDDTADGSGIAELESRVGEKLPRTGAIRTGGGHATLLFAVDAWMPKVVPLLTTPRGNVDFLGWPTITVLPGSRSGKGKYSWLAYPAEVGIAQLPARFCSWIIGLRTSATQNRTKDQRNTEECNTENSCVAPDICVALVSRAIERAVPDVPGVRWHSLFRLARSIKGIPQYSDATQVQLRPIVEAWYEKAKGAIRTKDVEISHREFWKAYRDVKCPGGIGGALHSMVDPRLANQPLAVRIVSLCEAMQLNAGDTPFYASCRAVGEAMDAHHAAVSRVLKELTRDGVLKLEFYGRGHRRRASEYRFIGGPDQGDK